MNFLMNMRISHKISVLMIGLIFGFIVIGVTYYVQIKVDNDTRGLEQQTAQFQNDMAELNLQQSRMQAVVRQFVSQSDDAIIGDYEQSFGEVERLLTVLNDEKLVAPAPVPQEGANQTSNLTGIGTTLRQYNENFRALVTLVDAAAGDGSASNRLANSATQVQNLLTLSQDPSLVEDFGAIRGAERAFVASGQISDQDLFFNLSERFSEKVATADPDGELATVFAGYTAAFTEATTVAAGRTKLVTQLNSASDQLNQSLATTLAQSNLALQDIVGKSSTRRQLIQAVVTAIIFAVAIGTTVGVYLLYKSIVFPMVHIQSVIRKINRGKTATRVKVLTGDELGDLGKAFNKLLDERIQQLEAQSQENEHLNESIISLIQALGLIAQKDLTVRVPVSSDITGTVSDAVNLFTTETAKTLSEVRDISEEVNIVSDQLQQQSTLVMQVAENEKRQILATSKALEILARAMNDVAKESEFADQAATKAIESTQSARQSVVETVSGIRTIRETISETEKRTKRLGDRSQEISGIVNLINTIAERTHILALNASMHAASAGEAGKGFAVVADEVQRLAENARQSTDEIAAMVNNMRVETSDTVNIMNTLISQVAEGSRLAEQAGTQMSATEQATQELVSTVKKIADQATQQADVANRVRDRSSIIRKFSEQAGKQLEEQKNHTDSLKRCADTLVERVSVFTLPAPQNNPPIEVAVETDNISQLQAAG